MEGGGVQLGEWKPVDDLRQQAEAHWELKAEESLWKHWRKHFCGSIKENPEENIDEHLPSWKMNVDVSQNAPSSAQWNM